MEPEVIADYVRQLLAADMMRVQTGYPMKQDHKLAVGAFRLLDKEKQQEILKKFQEKADEILMDGFVQMMLPELQMMR
jgi:hypothetical protein